MFTFSITFDQGAPLLSAKPADVDDFCNARGLARRSRVMFFYFLRGLSSMTPTFLMLFLTEVIFEKCKSPCGHDNPSFGAFAPNHFCRKSFLRNLKAPAGMTTCRSGFCPKSFLPDAIFEKFKGPCRHDNPSFGACVPFFCRVSFLRNLKVPAGMTTRRSGLLPQIIFAGCHF